MFLLSGILCMFAQGWTITDIQVRTLQRARSPTTHTRPQFELSHFSKAGSLCLAGGMLALLVGERMLRDFATSTVFESGAGVVVTLLPLCLSLI